MRLDWQRVREMMVAPAIGICEASTRPPLRNHGAVSFVIVGQPCSKANSRRLVALNGSPRLIKSKEALAYERDARRQIPRSARRMMRGPVRVTLHLYYASERPDLDESIVLDVMQPVWGKLPGQKRVMVELGVYANDRQVREKHVFHHVDRKNPRAEIVVECLEPQLLESADG